jgi:hypothetical protein
MLRSIVKAWLISVFVRRVLPFLLVIAVLIYLLVFR